MAKVTFSVDDGTIRLLKATAERLKKPQSLVVREPVAEYASRAGQLSDAERTLMLRQLDVLMALPPSRPQAEAEAEAREVRRAPRARRREIDLAIAACAVADGAALWTLNPKDFDDIPGLELAGA